MARTRLAVSLALFVVSLLVAILAFIDTLNERVNLASCGAGKLASLAAHLNSSAQFLGTPTGGRPKLILHAVKAGTESPAWLLGFTNVVSDVIRSPPPSLAPVLSLLSSHLEVEVGAGIAVPHDGAGGRTHADTADEASSIAGPSLLPGPSSVHALLLQTPCEEPAETVAGEEVIVVAGDGEMHVVGTHPAPAQVQISPDGYLWVPVRACQAVTPIALSIAHPLLAAAAIVLGPGDAWATTDLPTAVASRGLQGPDEALHMPASHPAVAAAQESPSFLRFTAGRARRRRGWASTEAGLDVRVSFVQRERSMQEGMHAVHALAAGVSAASAALHPFLDIRVGTGSDVGSSAGEGRGGNVGVRFGDEGLLRAVPNALPGSPSPLSFVADYWSLAAFPSLNSHLGLRKGASDVPLFYKANGPTTPLSVCPSFMYSSGSGSARSPAYSCNCTRPSYAGHEGDDGEAHVGRSALAMLNSIRRWFSLLGGRKVSPCPPGTSVQCSCYGPSPSRHEVCGYCLRGEGYSTHHMVAAMPPTAVRPLFVQDAQGALGTAFDIRGWGTVHIANSAVDGWQDAALKDMAVSVRGIAGLPPAPCVSVRMGGNGSLSYVRSDAAFPLSSTVLPWETRMLARRWWSVHCLALLDTMQGVCDAANIHALRVPARVNSALDLAFQAGYESASLLAQAEGHGDGAMPAAMEWIRLARIHAETAGTDPDGLPDPWMPTVHLAAVYGPMWAPLLLPLLIAIFKSCKDSQAKAKAKACGGEAMGKGTDREELAPVGGPSLHAAAAVLSSKALSPSEDAIAGNGEGCTPGALPSLRQGHAAPATPTGQLVFSPCVADPHPCQSTPSPPVPPQQVPTAVKEADAGSACLYPPSSLHPMLDDRVHACAGQARVRIRPARLSDLPALRLLYLSGQCTHITSPASAAVHLTWARHILRGDLALDGAQLSSAYCSGHGRSRLWVATVDEGDYGQLTRTAVRHEAMSPTVLSRGGSSLSSSESEAARGQMSPGGASLSSPAVSAPDAALLGGLSLPSPSSVASVAAAGEGAGEGQGGYGSDSDGNSDAPPAVMAVIEEEEDEDEEAVGADDDEKVGEVRTHAACTESNVVGERGGQPTVTLSRPDLDDDAFGAAVIASLEGEAAVGGMSPREDGTSVPFQLSRALSLLDLPVPASLECQLAHGDSAVPPDLLGDGAGGIIIGSVACVPLDMDDALADREGKALPGGTPGWMPDRAPACELKRMTVAVQVQRCGVARALVAHLEAWAKAGVPITAPTPLHPPLSHPSSVPTPRDPSCGPGFVLVYLTTLSSMRSACALYRGCGFTEVGAAGGRPDTYAGGTGISIAEFAKALDEGRSQGAGTANISAADARSALL